MFNCCDKFSSMLMSHVQIYIRSAGSLFVVAVIAINVPNADAELVVLKLENQQSGHAWLFGSPLDASCWIATPAHVVKANGRLVKGLLQLPLEERESQLGGIPIQPDPDLDLAFAPVDIGRRCLDRLGRKDLAGLIDTADNVKLTVLHSSVKESYGVTVRSMSASNHEISVEPTRTQDRFVQGFSGSLISAAKAGFDGEDVPVAMLLSVCEPGDFDLSFEDAVAGKGSSHCDGVNHYGVALRFDVIRRAFLGLQAIENERTASQKGSDLTEIIVLSTSGQTLSAAHGASNAFGNADKGNCWRVRVDKNGRANAIVRMRSAPIQRVRVYLCSDSSENPAPAGLAVKFRHEESSTWSQLRYCRSRESHNLAIDCTVMPANATEFLLEFNAPSRQEAIAIGAVEIDVMKSK